MLLFKLLHKTISRISMTIFYSLYLQVCLLTFISILKKKRRGQCNNVPCNLIPCFYVPFVTAGSELVIVCDA